MDIEQIRREAEKPVRAASAADLEGVARDLSAAFVDDPLFNWFSRANSGRDAARLVFFRFLMQASLGPGAEALRPASGGAAAVWMGSETQGPNSLIQELQALPVLLGLTGWGRFSRMLRLRSVMDKAHPMDRPHAYLWFLGVTPERLDKLDADGTPAFLETATERNVALYRRHGFDVIQQYRPPPDGPPMWAMWREAPGGGG